MENKLLNIIKDFSEKIGYAKNENELNNIFNLSYQKYYEDINEEFNIFFIDDEIEQLENIKSSHRYIVLDRLVYRIRKNDYENLLLSFNSCCGTCNNDTLNDLRSICNFIKNNYTSYTKEYHYFETPI